METNKSDTIATDLRDQRDALLAQLDELNHDPDMADVQQQLTEWLPKVDPNSDVPLAVVKQAIEKVSHLRRREEVLSAALGRERARFSARIAGLETQIRREAQQNWLDVSRKPRALALEQPEDITPARFGNAVHAAVRAMREANPALRSVEA